jgi:ATPase subunit of ABC transporter with duplicated ATPase domains
MKIIKTSTYNYLINSVEELQNQVDFLEEQQKRIWNEHKNEVHSLKMNFSIKRAIVGKKGSGKTTFIQSLLKQIRNYYIIDFTGEYSYLPKEKVFTATNSFNEVLKQITLHKDSVIIIDSANVIERDFRRLLASLNLHNDYIVSFESKKSLEQNISANSFDFIYDLGTVDDFQNVYVKENRISRIKRAQK